MQGLVNTANFILENWSNIVFVAAVFIAVFFRIKKFFSMSKEDQKEAVLKVVKEEILKIMSDAEKDWDNYVKSGEIKKSQVINTIYEQFPALSSFANQDEIIKQISDMIDEVKPTMDKIFEKTESK